MKILRLLLLLLPVVLASFGCTSGKRSSSRIVAGEGSHIKYTSPESAGGRVGGR